MIIKVYKKDLMTGIENSYPLEHALLECSLSTENVITLILSNEGKFIYSNFKFLGVAK